jgi:hypothetical protein
MRVSNTNEAANRFAALKQAIRDRAEADGAVKVDGDRYEALESFRVSLPDPDMESRDAGCYTILKGSHFDATPCTEDRITVDSVTKYDVNRIRYEFVSRQKEQQQRLAVNLSTFTDAWADYGFPNKVCLQMGAEYLLA